MTSRLIIPLLTGILASGLTAAADPPEESRFQRDIREASIQPALTPARVHSHPHVWGKGQVLPSEFRSSEFRNWRAYQLEAPSDGYQWVRVDRGAYRVNLETGYIAEAVFGLPQE